MRPASLFANVKRFRERWGADDRFRKEVVQDAAAAFAGADLADLDPESLAFYWRPGARVDPAAPEVIANQRIEDEAQAYFEFARADDGAILAYREWRARQRARCAFALGPIFSPLTLHLPFAVELTRGCSLGCWFCGVSAIPLQAVLETDLLAWEEMLCALKGVFGTTADRGFLFWATDPLDHPDYEDYAVTFARVLGRFPTTTTAAAHSDFGRTRKLISLSRAGDSPALRFSIVSLRRLNELHAEFPPVEIADVSLVPVNRESVLALAEAGHARRKGKRLPEKIAREREKITRAAYVPVIEPEALQHRTIACVSGFLVEPIEQRVRLITPEPCSDRWPDGYAVLDEARFERAGELAPALEGIVARCMQSDPPPRLALQRGIELDARSPHHVRAAANGHEMSFKSKHRSLVHLTSLAESFRGGASTDETVRCIASTFGLNLATARKDLRDLWSQGVLIESEFDFSDTA